VSLTLADNSGLALADAVAQLRTAGHAVLYEPANQPWGERMAYVADPDGNPVMICARI
jgi:lactoylglutathione lyase